MNSALKIILFFVFLNGFSIAAQKAKLGESEIRESEKIRFTNRSNQRAADSVKKQNDSIGKRLSQMVESEPNGVHDYKGVSARRILGDKNGLFGGDVISLDEDSGFGHINSVYRILASYIENSFGYSEEKADIIALYVLYYNAMHRNEKSYFKTKYANNLSDVLKVNSTGIGKSYRDWPGKTQIVIPLETNILKQNEIDVTLDELGEEVNKIIEEKKNGLEDKKKFEEVVKEKIIEEKKLIEAKKEELKVKEEKIALKEKAIDAKLPPEAKKEVVETKKTDPKEVIKEKLTEPAKNAEPVKTVVQPKETAVTKNETKSVEKAPEVKREPADVKKVEKELAVVKQELAKKVEAENKKKEFSPNVIDGKIVFLKVVKYDTAEGHFNSELHLIDPEKDDAVLKSDFNKICSRQFKEFGGNIVVVGFKDGHKDEHQLFLMSKKDLKEVGKSTSNIFSRTVIEIIGEELYAFEFEKGAYYISKFDKSLRRILKSDKEINPDSNLTFYGKKIYVTGKAENGNSVDIRVFNKEDLKFISKIQP